MSMVQQPGEPGVLVLPPEAALRAAKSLPAPEKIAIEGVSDQEWSAFAEALAEE